MILYPPDPSFDLIIEYKLFPNVLLKENKC